MGDRQEVRLISLYQDYRAGRLLTGQLKARCIKVLQEFTGAFQEVLPQPCYVYNWHDLMTLVLQRRKMVTDEEIKAFMDANRKIVPTLERKVNPA